MDSVLGEITVIQIADLGKIKFMSLKMDGERLIRFVGPNEAGKSTVLDRLQNLFKNASSIPAGIIRKGIYNEGQNAGKPIDRGMARIETSNGYVIEQIIRNTKAGEQKAELKVTQNGMPIAGGPLQFLQSVSTKYPDPHVVANLSEKELFAELFSILKVDLSQYDEIIADAKLKAQEARAGLKILGAEKTMPSGEKPTGAGLNFDELIEQKKLVAEKYETAVARYNKGTADFDNLSETVRLDTLKIAELEEQLSALRSKNTANAERVGKGRAWLDDPANKPNRTALDEIEEKISVHMRSGELVTAWKEYDKDIENRRKYSDTLEESAEIVSDQERLKKEAVANVAVPATRMKIYEDGSVVRVDGDEVFHWDTLSMSARLVAATELCIATIPENAFRAIYIERGESIGTEYRTMIAKLAAEKDVQVFMEVFSEEKMTGDGIFLLEEGEIQHVFTKKEEFISMPPNSVTPEIDKIEPIIPDVKEEVVSEEEVTPKENLGFAAPDPDAVPTVIGVKNENKVFDLF